MFKNKPNIAQFVLILLISSVSVLGQSRLDVGKNPVKPKYNEGGITAALFKAPNTKFVLNNNSVVNSFYRTKLMTAQSASKNAEQNILEREEPVSIGTIFPNPANDVAYLQYNNNAKNKQVKVIFYDLLGRKVSDYAVRNGEGKITVDTGSWENGMYLYQLSVDGRKVSTKKLLVRHY